MKEIIGQAGFLSLLMFTMFAPADNTYVVYAGNLLGFINVIMFFVMLLMFFAIFYIDEILKKDPPKNSVSSLRMNWMVIYTIIIVVTFAAKGWFISALIWLVVGWLGTSFANKVNDVYEKNNPDESKVKSTLEEMADGNE